MRIAYLDCFSGISGDMFLGALLDAGVPLDVFEKTVAALGIGARLEVSRVDRSGISAAKVDVLVNGEKELPREVFWERNHGHEHEHGIANEHPHSHEHSRAAGPEAHGRSLKKIKQIISAAPIAETAKTTANAIFEALGEAEAKIHNTQIDSIHFHEVGAVDAMVDIVCAAVGAEVLRVDEWVCSALNVGGGTVKCAHGTFPVPAPATVELLKNAPVYSSGLNFELVTPTGAAIVKTLANRFSTFPKMTIESAGYGAGTRELPGHANVVRITIGELMADASSELNFETVSVLEANIDDLNPQVLGYVMDRLLKEGALDVFAIPAQMKKNRPGTLLTVLSRPEDADRLARVIFSETSTLGVRRRDEQRQVLKRRWVTVATRWGDVRMKVAGMNRAITNYAPEYEDCRGIAAAHGVPLKSVMQEAIQQYLQSKEQEFTTKDTKVSNN